MFLRYVYTYIFFCKGLQLHLVELNIGKRIKSRTRLHIPRFSFDKASAEQTFSKEHFKIAFLEKELDRLSFKRSVIYS